MKTRNLLMTAAILTAVLAFGNESNAAGRGAGGGGGYSASTSTTQVRPAGSQRRDGTFLTTGTTASGTTTRPTNGRGVMNGTGINATTPVTPTTTTAQ